MGRGTQRGARREVVAQRRERHEDDNELNRSPPHTADSPHSHTSSLTGRSCRPCHCLSSHTIHSIIPSIMANHNHQALEHHSSSRISQCHGTQSQLHKGEMDGREDLDHQPPSSSTSSTDRLDERLHLSRVTSLILLVDDQVIHELSNLRVSHRPHVGLSSLPLGDSSQHAIHSHKLSSWIRRPT